MLVDLNLPGLDVARVVDLARRTGASSAQVVAFGPHVHESKLKAAATAGCDAVLARGQFRRRVGQILQEHLGVSG